MTVGDLLSDLAVWGKEPNAATKWPLERIISLADNRIRRDLRPQELDEGYSFDPETAAHVRGKVYSIALPADYQALVSLTNNGFPLKSALHDRLMETAGRTASAGSDPWLYTTVGKTIRYGPGVGGDLAMVYTKKDAALDTSNVSSSNVGLASYYDIYLTAALAYLARFREDQENENAEWGRYSGLVMTANEIEDDKRRGAGSTGVV